MSDIKAIEYPTLKVPYEILNKQFRATQKNIDREVCHVATATSDLEKGINSGEAKVGEIKLLLGSVVEKLNILKRKADESLSEEVDTALLCKRRLEHLKEGAHLDSKKESEREDWAKKRVDRMLVEHFLRAGYYETALKLADRCDIRSLTNIEVFLVSRDVEESLKRRDTASCLAWCYDNKSKLRKLKSTLEFNLRQQEFIELVRKGQNFEAVKHARKHFSSIEEDQVREVQQVMMLLALSLNTALSPYKELLDPSRWKKLVEQFRFENYRLYQLSSMSVFTVTLQAGLSALKTPQCYRSSFLRQDSSNPDCPVCYKHLNILAQPLPFAHCAQSRLICFLSGDPLNENNVPMMLPNGFVYGEIALKQMAGANRGKISCPRTGEVFDIKDCEKVFVM